MMKINEESHGEESKWREVENLDEKMKIMAFMRFGTRGSHSSLEETQESLHPLEGVLWFWFPPFYTSISGQLLSRSLIDDLIPSLSCLVFTSHISSCLLSLFFLCLPLAVLLLSFFSFSSVCACSSVSIVWEHTHTCIDSDELYWPWKLMNSTKLYLNNN